MLTTDEYCRRLFGEKLYRLSLNGSMTCPNRDGTKGTRGCLFCSGGGSGDFAADADLPIDRQIEQAKERIAGKFRGNHYIAYFQAYTNTYASRDYLEKLFMPVIQRPDIRVLSIATRPDCLPDDVLSLIGELNRIKPVWIELGLQTIHESTARFIRRGYETRIYDEAADRLNSLGIHVITHVILGLPGETRDMMLETVRHVISRSGGIKLQLLHVLKGTDLADLYERGLIDVLSEEAYLDILKACLDMIPSDTVVHRMTGDGPKKLLIAPMWSANKKHVLNEIRRMIDGGKR